MTLYYYSVRDHLTGFMTPVLEQNDAVAIRNFSMACNVMKSDSSLMAYRPTDFSLFKIGIFDTDTGLITPITPAELISNGQSVSGGKKDV